MSGGGSEPQGGGDPTRRSVPHALRASGQGNRVIVEYEFSTGGGGHEHFTYDYSTLTTSSAT
ncbi:MAG: hypothetical protein ACREXR_06415 [Gammaproteobacteria bacterium]